MADWSNEQLNILGLIFYKNMNYKQKNKSYNFNVYAVADLEQFTRAGLFNGWLLTINDKFACHCEDVPPCSWSEITHILLYT